ncbi:HRDC domain-containing protein [Pseudogemmatithrix spongiicola]|uniref:HRDC domain-containing protein n=1 Tax=Pseudogemmatithrix spongiicola TaxID=3062599 RepID=A0AA49Q908_9BACT|nr:HRDC domain-containing protein [Gemmatimonadaceae bacterium 'strain 138']WKW16334.1 HRDC domain-containing protein [Gemmatimonadaceae bacterium 'strain 318']
MNPSAPRSAKAPSAQYLDTDAAVRAWLAAAKGARRLALDTEGASFHRFVDRIYLLQLSTDNAHAVIDPLPIESPALLGAMIEDPAIEIVFHDADYDLRLLHQDYGWNVRNVFDTRVAAQLLGIKAFGLAALLEQYFGVKLDKKHQRADWSMRPLTADMLDYAAQDTIHLLGLRDELHGQLVKKGRLAWAKEEFERLESVRWPADDANGFLKVKGARDLTRRELAVFRELVQWRDGAALKLDRATFRVVSNEVLLEAAKAHPASKETLANIKGMPRGILERSHAEIIEAIDRGLAVPEAALPKFPKSARWDRDPDFDHKVGALKAVRDAAAARLELDPGVLCSRERMESVARMLPAKAEQILEIPEFRCWQVEELGADFVKALEPWRKKESPYLD